MEDRPGASGLSSGRGRPESEHTLVFHPASTPRSAIDAALGDLTVQKDAWLALPASERIPLLDQSIRDMTAIADRWVSASLAAKGFPRGSMSEAEEWLFLAVVLRALRLLRRSMVDIARSSRPGIPGPIRRSAGGQVVAGVVPRDLWERIVYRGLTAEVWMEPEVAPDEVLRDQARGYRDANRRSDGVALVLGAGNASMIPVVDLLHELFVDNHVVLLKPSPVNEYLGPLIEEGLGVLVRRGFLRVVYGGVEEGAYLCEHPAVDEIHLTGSARTFDSIMFGVGEEGLRRKLAGEPIITKPFTCELGNVSPVIVVPGPWSRRDLRDQAEQIATWLVANAGFGCLTPQVIIQHRSWPLRAGLLEELGRVLATVPTRPAYYPGAKGRHAALVESHPGALQFGQAGDGHLPWTLIPDVDSADAEARCFREEAFCGVLAETALEAASVTDFIDRSVSFANEVLWGTLNATLIVHPASMRDPRVSAALDRAVARLRYGAVTINAAAFSAYYFLVTPWGGFMDHGRSGVQSGLGKTANLLMFGRPQKSVVRAQFWKRFDRLRVGSKRAHLFARRLAHFEASPSVSKAAGLLREALRR